MLYYYNFTGETKHTFCMVIDELDDYFINISYEDYEGEKVRYSIYDNIYTSDNKKYDKIINKIITTTMKDVPSYVKTNMIDIIKKEKIKYIYKVA